MAGAISLAPALSDPRIRKVALTWEDYDANKSNYFGNRTLDVVRRGMADLCQD